MKFQFKVQQYQTDAVNSVVDVFKGQPYQERVSYIRDPGVLAENTPDNQISLFPQQEPEQIEISYGYENGRLRLNSDRLLQNIRTVQSLNNIKQSENLIGHLGACSLDVEMETGTGKTYVYIKTMFELNKHYGWSKFIVVVPSIAIREGVKKSFEITAEHFMEQYGKHARFFVYNSSNLNKLDEFSQSPDISVMIINTQAFASSLNEEKNVEGRKGDAAARIIYSKRDEFGSRRPIDIIRANRPIIILDEPQKMSGNATQKALENFDPLFTLNYSATHKEQHNAVYVLDAVDAYNKRLVKKIEVKGFELKNLRGTEHYMFLDSIILSPNKPPMAKIEFEIGYNKSINRETRIVGVGGDLYALSQNMDQYKGYTVSEIDPIRNLVTFTNGENILRGEVRGDASQQDMRRIQIRETIKSHFEKERRLFNRGIKTLSLFFIDEVSKYRLYDEDGNECNSEYGVMFEQEYEKVLNEYLTVFTDEPYQKYLRSISTESTHAGYFSIDKKTGRKVDSSVKKGSDEADDVSAYDLILKNKELLLNFDNPVRFIFSHSALREGWDNPNVFQICTLKHGGTSSTQKRQEVGRGLRLCVNQKGERMDAENVGTDVHDVNMLTVIASEGYKDFVSSLQVGIREALYDRPSKAVAEYFIDKTIMVGEKPVIIDADQARAIYRYLLKNDYVDDNDNIAPEYREAMESNTLSPLPDSLANMAEGIHKLIQSVFDPGVLDDMIDNGNSAKITENRLNENFAKKEFQTLWNYINHKYAYAVDFDSEELVKNAVKHLNEEMYVTRLQYTVTSGIQTKEMEQNAIRRGDSFEVSKTSTETMNLEVTNSIEYDLVGKIAEGTTLTRRTVAKILKNIEQHVFAMFRQNPEEFISKAIRIIREQKANMIVEHISYDRIEQEYDSSIFTQEKCGNFAKAYRSKKNVQDYVFADGTAEHSVEWRFAQDMDNAEEVCVYAKLPKGFHIPTPVGNYSPDWAIAFNEGTVKHIFFIAETKGTMESLNLRPIEQAKISCAKRLFNSISTSKVKYHDVDSYQKLLDVMGKV